MGSSSPEPIIWFVGARNQNPNQPNHGEQKKKANKRAYIRKRVLCLAHMDVCNPELDLSENFVFKKSTWSASLVRPRLEILWGWFPPREHPEFQGGGGKLPGALGAEKQTVPALNNPEVGCTNPILPWFVHLSKNRKCKKTSEIKYPRVYFSSRARFPPLKKKTPPISFRGENAFSSKQFIPPPPQPESLKKKRGGFPAPPKAHTHNIYFSKTLSPA